MSAPESIWTMEQFSTEPLIMDIEIDSTTDSIDIILFAINKQVSSFLIQYSSHRTYSCCRPHIPNVGPD